MTPGRKRYPVRRCSAALAACFLAGVWLVGAGRIEASVLAGAFLMCAGLGWLVTRRSFLPICCMLALAAGLLYMNQSWDASHALVSRHNQTASLEGHVLRAPTNKRWVDVRVQKVNGRETTEKGTVRITRKKNDVRPLYPGMRISVRAALRAPEPQRNPGGYDARHVLKGYGVFTTGLAEDAVRILSMIKTRESLMAAQQYFRAELSRHLSPQAASLMTAILLSDVGALSDAFYHRAQLLGMVHVFAVSGLHVGFLVAFVLAILRIFRVQRRFIGFILLLPLLIFYVLLVGMPPAAVRAAVMALLGLGISSLHRYKDPLTILSYAAVALVFVNPFCLWQMGFQLSFVVTAALIFLLPEVTSWLSPLPKKIAGGLGVAITSECAGAPLIAYYYHLFTPLGIIANILMVPLVSLAVPLTFLALLLNMCWTPLAQPFFAAVNALASLLILFIRVPGALLSQGHIHMGMPEVGRVILAYALIFTAATAWPAKMLRRLTCSRRWTAILLAGAMLILYKPAADDFALGVPDVGEGLSFVWQTSDGKWIVVDTGPSPDTVAGYLRAAGVQHIEALIITGWSQDKTGGLAHILSDFSISYIYVPPEIPTRQKEQLAAGKVPVVPVPTSATGYVGKTKLFLEAVHNSEKAPHNKEIATSVLTVRLESEGLTLTAPGAALQVQPAEILLLSPESATHLEDLLAAAKPQWLIEGRGKSMDTRSYEKAVNLAKTAHIPYLSTEQSGALAIYRPLQPIFVHSRLNNEESLVNFSQIS